MATQLQYLIWIRQSLLPQADMVPYADQHCARKLHLSIQNSMGHIYSYNIKLDQDILPNYESYTWGEAAIRFFNRVSNFLQEAVCDWNHTRDDVTLSYNMRFVGVHEDSSDGAATVILDMFLKFGVLVYNQDERWALSWTARFRRLYCFGDWKTIKNGTAFVNKLSNRSLSFELSSLQAEIFWMHSVLSCS